MAENGFLMDSVKAEITFTNKNGDTYTVVNESLAVVEGHGCINDYLGE